MKEKTCRRQLKNRVACEFRAVWHTDAGNREGFGMRRLGRIVMWLAFVVVSSFVVAGAAVWLFGPPEVVSPSAPEGCEPPDPCWAERHQAAANEPCWRAIESAANALGRWRWDGLGRLTEAAVLRNGTILYYGERMAIISANGIERVHHYTCAYDPERGTAEVPVLQPGPLPD
jgi:hypothetical protein